MKQISATELAREFCNARNSTCETPARQLGFLELSSSMRSCRTQNGGCPTEEVRKSLEHRVWELGEAGEMHESCEAVCRLEQEVGKGGLIQINFVTGGAMGSIIRLSCFY